MKEIGVNEQTPRQIVEELNKYKEIDSDEL